MNIIQERTVHNSKSSIEATRRALATLESFGWKLSLANQPNEDFDKQLSALEETTASIRNLRPKADRSHEKELTALLEKESYYVESLDALARAAANCLKQEEILFFEARDEITAGAKKRIEQADRDAESALAVLLARLQARWQAMGDFHKLQGILHYVSTTHGTSPVIAEPEMRLPRPFAKKPVGVWPAFIQTYLLRVNEIFSGSENADPAQTAERVYDRTG